MMGRIATGMADYVIITSDNPRTEDPQLIVKEIEDGVIPGSPYEVVVDRKAAIRKGLDLIGKDDSLVIAGKGHEDYQVVGAAKVHFDDREIAHEALREKGWRR